MAFRFGDFVLDRDTRQLLFRQEDVHLSPKAFDLLTILLVNRPRVVSKADLQHQLWPSTFVEESNIAGLVTEVRGALRDSASDPKFVHATLTLDFRGVSRAHARILVSGGEATVEDLGSKNGTYVNGERITTPHRMAVSEGPTETVTIQDK